MIINGDCLAELAKLPADSVDCCITDCPYRIIAGGVRIVDEGDECSGVLGKRDYSKTDPKGCLNSGRKMVSDGTVCSNKWLKKNQGDIACAVKNGKMFSHNDITFKEWLPALYRVMKPGTHTYIMVNGRNLSELQAQAEVCANTPEELEKIALGKRAKKKGFVYQNLLIWHKTNTQTPNKYYMQNSEFILMFRKGPARNINHMGSKSVISIPNIIGTKDHATQKPVALTDYLLRNSTNEGEVVIDPFMGTGGCGVSAKNLNRGFIGFEIDKKYYDIAKIKLTK